MDNDQPLIEVIIEYDQFIAGRELSEIIELLDEAIWYELSEMGPDRYMYRYQFSSRYDRSPPSMICIAEVKEGSIHLGAMLGGAAAKYCFDRFNKGFKRARIGDEIEHLGQMVGANLEYLIKRMSEWLEEYTVDAKEKRSRIKSIKVRRKGGG